MILKRGASITNPYEGILLERANLHGKMHWLVYFFYVDEQTGGFSPTEIINVPVRKFVQEEGKTVGVSLSEEEKTTHTNQIKNACASSLSWVEEDKIKSWMREALS